MIPMQALSPRVFVAACLVCLVVSVAACGGLYWSTEPCRGDWYGTRIEVPANATLVYERCRSAFNPDYTVVFTIPPDALADFQGEAPIVTWSDDAVGLLHWQSEARQATSLLAGRFINGAIAVEALVDLSDPARYTVYYQSTFVD